MKFNVTYSPASTLLETLKDISAIKEVLLKEISSLREFTKIVPPAFLEENDLRIVDMATKTRSVTFDFGDEYKVGTMVLSHTNWIRSMIKRTELPVKEGFVTDTSYIWRDIVDNPTSTAVRDELSFQFKAQTDNADEEAKNIVQDLYESIHKIDKVFKEKHQIRTSYPEFAQYISAQQMANEMPGETFRQREIDTIIETEAFIFEAAGKKLFSGKTHTLVSPTLYDHKAFYQVVLKDNVNSNVLKVASVGVLASGQVLTDQLHLNDLSDLLTNSFYSEIINDEEKIIEIKINVPRLAMAILNKGHIGEVQAGVISQEAESIKEKQKIEVI